MKLLFHISRSTYNVSEYGYQESLFKTVMKALFEIIFEDKKQILYNLSFLKVLFES